MILMFKREKPKEDIVNDLLAYLGISECLDLSKINIKVLNGVLDKF